MLPGSIAQSPDAKPGIDELQVQAVTEHLGRLGLRARAESGQNHRVRIRPSARTDRPLVSIIIPTRDAPQFLERCLDSIYRLTTYMPLECVLGDNDTVDPRALRLMRGFPVVRVPCPGTFNYSRVNNDCARASSGEILIFLNNDTEVVTPNWIEELLYYAEQADVGAVCPLLLYPDGLVQHAGVILGPRGTADHLMRRFPAHVDGYAGSLVASREVTAGTAACLMTRRSVFQKVGGFNEYYHTHYQDVDLCLRMRRAGLRNIYTRNAHLLHHESVSRGPEYDLLDRHLLLDGWHEWIEQGDPYYNLNFDPQSVDYSLRASAVT